MDHPVDALRRNLQVAAAEHDEEDAAGGGGQIGGPRAGADQRGLAGGGRLGRQLERHEHLDLLRFAVLLNREVFLPEAGARLAALIDDAHFDGAKRGAGAERRRLLGGRCDTQGGRRRRHDWGPPSKHGRL